jgi:hypothetical protein
MYGTEEWKGYFINNLIKDLNYSSYLELGVAAGESWHQIKCNKKVGVDNNPNIKIPGVVLSTTDQYFDFFIDEDVNYDLIYIDAYHEKNQVKKDFYNSWDHLNPGGMIIMHDVNPPSKSGTSQAAHGDCFEFWIELVKKYPNNVSVFSGGTICGQVDSVGVWFKEDETISKDDIISIDNTYEYFVENHSKYIKNLELTYEKILNRMEKNGN